MTPRVNKGVRPSDEAVRLELDAPSVPLPTLVSAAGILANVVQEVSRDLRGGESVEWTVSVESGSVVLPVKPQAPDHVRQELIHAVANGLAQVEEKPERPPHFNDRALIQARALANLSTDDVPISVRNGKRATHLTKRLVANVDEVTGDGQPRIGTVEGRLESVNIHGRPTFAVWERLTDSRVECIADAETVTVDDLRAALGRRVAVRGRIRASKEGVKRKVDVAELQVFPSEEQLPTADEVRGILPGT